MEHFDSTGALFSSKIFGKMSTENFSLFRTKQGPCLVPKSENFLVL